MELLPRTAPPAAAEGTRIHAAPPELGGPCGTWGYKYGAPNGAVPILATIWSFPATILDDPPPISLHNPMTGRPVITVNRARPWALVVFPEVDRLLILDGNALNQEACE